MNNCYFVSLLLLLLCLGVILISVNLIALFMLFFYGYTIFQNIFYRGLIFFQQLGRKNKIELKFDNNIHGLDFLRTGFLFFLYSCCYYYNSCCHHHCHCHYHCYHDCFCHYHYYHCHYYNYDCYCHYHYYDCYFYRHYYDYYCRHHQ